MVSLKLLIAVIISRCQMKCVHCSYLLKGLGHHIPSSCPLNWQWGPILAAVDMSCMPLVGRSELLQKKTCSFILSVLFGFMCGVFVWSTGRHNWPFICCYCCYSLHLPFIQIFWGCSEYNQEPAPRWADHWPGEWGVLVSPVQISVQYCCPPHPTGTPII